MKDFNSFMKNHCQILKFTIFDTATCERGFWKFNIEKTSLRTRVNSQILSNTFCIMISSTSLEELNPEIVVARWLDDRDLEMTSRKTQNSI